MKLRYLKTSGTGPEVFDLCKSEGEILFVVFFEVHSLGLGRDSFGGIVAEFAAAVE